MRIKRVISRKITRFMRHYRRFNAMKARLECSANALNYAKIRLTNCIKQCISTAFKRAFIEQKRR